MDVLLCIGCVGASVGSSRRCCSSDSRTRPVSLARLVPVYPLRHLVPDCLGYFQRAVVRRPTRRKRSMQFQGHLCPLPRILYTLCSYIPGHSTLQKCTTGSMFSCFFFLLLFQQFPPAWASFLKLWAKIVSRDLRGGGRGRGAREVVHPKCLAPCHKENPAYNTCTSPLKSGSPPPPRALRSPDLSPYVFPRNSPTSRK